MLCMSMRTCKFNWRHRILDLKRVKAGMCEYPFLYNIINEKNRTSDSEGGNDEEDSEAESESALDMDVDNQSIFYSYNIIILN